MTDLEKFKRRLIRTVARLRKEDIPEKELWEQLQKTTNCDCEWLWHRMRALTIKRLGRLLVAMDRPDTITPIARMTLTDWMMFDFVLVHEKIDFTGANCKSEPLSMIELFSLVQRFRIEGLQGDKLASAWTAATVHYNSGGRQCSPMLLQRRWYQIKELTRDTFYKFWYSYRGNPRLLEDTRKLHTPTKLQRAVAKRYPHIITLPFMPWEEMIEKGMAILPDEFEKKMRALNNASDLPKPCSDNSPDLIIVEPDIEVIDLRVDSDSETEFNDQDLANEAEKILAATTNDKAIDLDLTDVTAETNDTQPSTSQVVKAEPIDVNADELDDEYLATKYMPKQYNISNNKVIDIVNTFSDNYSDDQDVLNVQDQPAEELAIDPTDDPMEELTTDPTDDPVEEQTTDATVDPTDDSTILDDNETIKEQSCTKEASPGNLEPEPEIIMPLITNVFGNVHIENETLAKISSVLMEKSKDTSVMTDVIPLNLPATDKQSTSTEPIEVVDDDIEDIDASEDIIKCDSFKSSTNTCDVKDNMHINVGNEINHFEDVTLMDDGIEFLEDGITLSEDCDVKDIHIRQSHIKEKEIIGCDANQNEESSKFDLKLLMDSVVYTTKLEDMIYFKNKCFEHVKLEENVDDIIKESKPVKKNFIQNPRKENIVQPKCEFEDKDINDDLFDNNSVVSDNSVTSNNENEISEKMKVKISSGLLQKPRIRTYNPINLCKNPDFNTRLKRLTVGFLSSTRNRRLLKICKPMTIDVNKVFESKLIDGTLYLKSSSVLDNNAVKPDADECNNSGNQSTTVVPSAMLVQSLMDNIKVSDVSWPSLTNNNSTQKHNNDQIVSNYQQDVCERKKVINLPDIGIIRRINQRLLTAEVTPIQVHKNKEIRPPVQIIPQSSEKCDKRTSDFVISGENQIQDFPHVIRNKENHLHGTSNVENIKVISNDTLPDNNQQATDNSLKRKGRKPKSMSIDELDHTLTKTNGPERFNWRPKHPASVSWLTQEPTNVQPKDFLLTVNTLNKMLHIICPDEEKHSSKVGASLKQYKEKLHREKLKLLQRKVDEYEKRISSNTSNLDDKQRENNDSHTLSTLPEEHLEVIGSELPVDNKVPKHKVLHAELKQNDKKVRRRKRLKLEQKVDEYEKVISSNTSDLDDKQKEKNDSHPLSTLSEENLKEIASELPVNNKIPKLKILHAEPTIKYNNDCCWARRKLYYSNPIKKHNCLPGQCTCCCKKELEESEHNKNVCVILSDDEEKPSLKNQQSQKTKSGDLVNINTVNTNIEDVENITNQAVDSISAKEISVNIEIECKSTGQNMNMEMMSQLNNLVTKVPDSILKLSNISSENNVPQSSVEQNAIFDIKESDIIDIDDDNFVEPDSSNYTESLSSTTSVVDSEVLYSNMSVNNSSDAGSTNPLFYRTQSSKNCGNNIIRQLIIDGTKGHTSRTSNISTNHVMHFNSKQLESPIFLGNNKILLTDVKLSNKSVYLNINNQLMFENNQISDVSNATQTVVLPHGGEMTYTNLTKAKHEPFTSTISTDIQQKQNESININASIVVPTIENVEENSNNTNSVVVMKDTSEVAVLNNEQNKVIIETDNVNVNSEFSVDVITSPSIETILKTENVDSISTKERLVKINNPAIAGEHVIENKTDGPERENIDSTNAKEISEEDTSRLNNAMTKEEYAVENETDGSGLENIDATNTKEILSEENNPPITKEKDIDSTLKESLDLGTPIVETNLMNTKLVDQIRVSNQLDSTITEHKESGDIASDKRKSILSDLMEMSGISAEDATPIVPNDNTYDSVLLPSTSRNDVLSEIPSAHSNIVNVDGSPVFSELYLVSTFNELRYAYNSGGNFYKCDLQTGILLQINMTIKRNPVHVDVPVHRPIAPKSHVIDLTNDNDVTEKTNLSVFNNKTKTYFKKQNPRSLLKRSTRKERNMDKQFVENTRTAIPLKLFKVVPNIIKKQTRQKNQYNEIESLVNTRKKKKRKQEFDSTYTIANEVLIVNDKTDFADDSYDDSSDDEPLAKKSKRMKQKTDDIVADESNVLYIDDKNATETVVKDNSNESLNIRPVLAAQLSFVSDIDMSQEDCILGV